MGKGVFLTWLKKWVLLTVFLKSCVFLKTLFYSVFSKTQFFKNKNCMLKKNRKFMKNSGLFLNMAKWCFGGFVFCKVLMFKGLFLVCVWHCFKSVKMLVFFSQFFVFSGVAHCCSSGFGRFRCFCVSCVCFLFCVAFVSVLFVLFLVLWLDVVFFFLVFGGCLFSFFCFVFLEGFKVK